MLGSANPSPIMDLGSWAGQFRPPGVAHLRRRVMPAPLHPCCQLSSHGDGWAISPRAGSGVGWGELGHEGPYQLSCCSVQGGVGAMKSCASFAWPWISSHIVPVAPCLCDFSFSYICCVLKSPIYSAVSSVLLMLINYIKSFVRVISVSHIFIDFLSTFYIERELLKCSGVIMDLFVFNSIIITFYILRHGFQKQIHLGLFFILIWYFSHHFVIFFLAWHCSLFRWCWLKWLWFIDVAIGLSFLGIWNWNWAFVDQKVNSRRL